MMADHDEIYNTMVALARRSGISLDAFLETDRGKELSQSYHEEISQSVGSPVAAQETQRQFDELLDGCGVSILDDDDEGEPYEIIREKAEEILVEGGAKNIYEATEIACKRLPHVADRHVRRMREGF